MAINLKFDLSGNPELPTIILANRNGNKLGQLKVNADSVDLNDKFNDVSELSFTVNKYVNDELTPLWDKLVDFKLVWCKEWDMWFEIKIELDEETETVKTVFCTQLGQAELSQIMLNNIEINTEDDIARDDYKISILWDEKDPKASILDRLLEKAPHYSIVHVDDTIKNIQRSFSFDGTSIYDAFQEIAEEIGCLFIYHSNSGENGKIQRTISVYDLQQNCNDCKHRSEFTEKCPKCGGTNIKQGYGEDTLIFVTSDELASKGIQLVTDTDSVKNCFKLEGGDDLMTATIRNCNPNGTDYIWYFSDAVKEDMSKELVEKLNSYDNLQKDYYNNHESKLDTNLVNEYNTLVKKYEGYYNTKSTCANCDYEGIFEDICPNCNSTTILSGKTLQSIPTTIKGYSSLMNAYYNTIDLALYLQSSLMPSIEMSGTTAKEQASLLTSSSLSPVAVNTENAKAISLATANSAVLSMAKIIVKSTYKVEVKTSTLSTDKVWEGNFIITNYSDETDTAESQTIKVTINNDTETFVKQKIEKALNKDDTDDYSISGLFEKDYDDFCAELKKYALNPLKSFYDSCDVCLNILIDQGAGNEDEKPDLYEKLYVPYYKKSTAISDEIKIRENEIAIIEGVWDKTDEKNPKLITKGLQQGIEECKNEIQEALDFEKYLGEELWLEFCAYRREDIYSNDNYISDGLNNAQLFEKALEFYDIAENEIYKSAELQHSISTSLNNLLAIDKFKSLVDSFQVGNWIRVQVDDKIFKLRLLEYGISFGSFDNISVEFSDVTKIKNGVTDVKNIIEQASSMATNYSSVQRQADKGNRARSTIDQWITDGLSAANVQIQSNNNEEVTMTENGLLCRSYDDITETYLPEQFRLTHNIMAYTKDNWETVSAALGKHEYTKWQNNQWVKDNDYGLSSKFVTAGYVTGSQIIGGEIVSSNYESGESGTYFNLIDGDFEIAGGNIVYDTSDKSLTLRNVIIEWSNSNAPEVTVNDITGIDGYLNQIDEVKSVADNAKDIGDKLVNGLGFKETEIAGSYVISPVIAGGTLLIGDESGTYAQITTDGQLICTGANITGDITASSLTITSDASIYGLDDYAKTDDIPTDDDIVSIVDGTVTAAYIKTLNLSVGNEIKMGEDATISWEQVTNTDEVATEDYVTSQGYQTETQVTNITNDTIKTTNVVAESLRVKAANIEGTLTAEQIDVSDIITVGEIASMDDIPKNVSQLTNDSGYQTETGVTTIVNGTVTTDYVNALGITAKSVAAENITGTTITGKAISGGTISIGSKFNVNKNGEITSTGGTIGGWKIGNSSIQKDVEGDSTISGYSYYRAFMQNPLLEYETNSSGQVVETTNRRVFGLYGYNAEPSVATQTTPLFYVNTTGKLYAKNAEIIGKITATEGSIGGCSISDGVLKIKNANIEGTISGKTISGGTISGATISGNTISGGTISGATISGNTISGGTISGATISGNTISGGTISIGSKFNVNKNGEITSTGGTIGGWTINTDSLSGATGGAYSVKLHPSGKDYSGTLYFLVVYDSGGSVPVGGICASGWKTI